MSSRFSPSQLAWALLPLCATALANTEADIQDKTQENYSYQKCEKVIEIQFRGNSITHEDVLNREFTIHPGDTFSEEKWLDSLQNLRNLRIFKSVFGKIERSDWDSTQCTLKVNIQEKQTLLPFFRMKKGGGSTLVVLGVGDLNTLGTGIAVLPMYENLNGEHHGGRVDLRVPHIFNSNTTIEPSVAAESQSRTIFKSNGVVDKNYLDTRKTAQLSFDTMISPSLHAIGYAMTQNVRAPGILKPTTFVHASIGFAIGAINYFDYRMQGNSISFHVENITSAKTSLSQHYQIEARHFNKISSTWDVAFRAQAVSLSANANKIHNCSIGGFAEVRGFLDERFQGKSCWFANIESRHIAYEHAWVVFQPTVFTDIGSASANTINRWNWPPAVASAGLGVRAIFPHLARLALRLDTAIAIKPNFAAPAFSLGSTQFF